MENNENAVTQTETVETEEKTEVSGEQPVEKNEKEEVKTFTQEEVNAMLAKEKKKMPSKDEMKAFNDWKESQKTEKEKSLEKDKKIEALEKQLSYAENKSVVANAGVDAKFQKFVLSEVSEIEGDFEDNLKDYLKENPQYLIQKNVETPKTNGVATKKISDDADDGVTAILKAKHPDLF